MLGRLGNNLFQYAAGRSLSEMHRVPLILDGSWFNQAGWRQVSYIKHLPIKAHIVRKNSIASRTLRKITGHHYWEYVNKPVFRESETNHTYNKKIHEMPNDCVLIGYFQSPKYFQDIEILLRHELDTNQILWPRSVNDEVIRLRKKNSIAVHIRRKDYTILPEFNVCDAAYYTQAIAMMRDLVPNAEFYIFSDDPLWCHEKFTANDQHVISTIHGYLNPLADFHIMKHAHHHIIANSSYSWWAAWLGKKQEQIVICPNKWYASNIIAPIHEKTCEGWTLI